MLLIRSLPSAFVCLGYCSSETSLNVYHTTRENHQSAATYRHTFTLPWSPDFRLCSATSTSRSCLARYSAQQIWCASFESIPHAVLNATRHDPMSSPESTITAIAVCAVITLMVKHNRYCMMLRSSCTTFVDRKWYSMYSNQQFLLCR